MSLYDSAPSREMREQAALVERWRSKIANLRVQPSRMFDEQAQRCGNGFQLAQVGVRQYMLQA